MATPTRSQMASTPKNHLSTTPGRSNASPRTNLGAFAGKTIGKSPAVKTPASIHGHAHRISLSSHPTSTPLAATSIPEDMLNMNTPSALIASMGPTGLTPLPNAQDGLGISTGMSGLPSTQDGPITKYPEKDRHERLQEVARTLKARTAGRGISRQHIQQLAKTHGFDEVLDDDNLTIAGQKFVDLEIVFDRIQENKVNKVSLRLNAPDQEEGTYQESASRVLTDNLKLDVHPKLPWHDLTDFSANLAYLSQLEHVDTTSSCFQVVDNLYDAFQRIWTEEKKRMKWRHDVHHLCQSNTGQPRKDANGRLGVSSTYWTRGHKFFAKEEAKVLTEEKEGDDWCATFSIEPGLPSIPVSQKWLAEDALTSTVRAEDIFQDIAIDKPSWQHPELSPQIKPLPSGDSMDLDQAASAPKEMLNVHFKCQLVPEVLLPLSIAQMMNERAQVVDLQQEQLSTFQQSVLTQNDAFVVTGDRWTKTQHSFNKSGQYEERQHSYMLYTNGQAWVHPIRKLSFSHPQQYAEALPILRQYALVNTLLQSIKPESGRKVIEGTVSSSQPNNMHKPLPVRGNITKRSNKPKLESKLDELLHPSQYGDRLENAGLPIDVRIDPHSSPTKSCRIEVRFPLSPRTLSRSTVQRLRPKPFLAIQIDILLNGIVEILSIDGIEIEKDRIEDFKKSIARVIRASEDLGLVVAWVLRELDSF